MTLTERCVAGSQWMIVAIVLGFGLVGCSASPAQPPVSDAQVPVERQKSDPKSSGLKKDRSPAADERKADTPDGASEDPVDDAPAGGAKEDDESPRSPQKVAQAQEKALLSGWYLLGHTGEALEVEGDRYRYGSGDGEGHQPWRPIRELEAIRSGVVYDGRLYWCLNTMKSRDQVGSCSREGWKISRSISQEPPAKDAPVRDSSDLVVPEFKVGMPYGEARQLALDAGWQPVMSPDDPDDRSQFWRDRGYPEVQACSGTGIGACRFEFKVSMLKRLVIVTGGKDSTVQKWWLDEDVP